MFLRVTRYIDRSQCLEQLNNGRWKWKPSGAVSYWILPTDKGDKISNPRLVECVEFKLPRIAACIVAHLCSGI